MDYETHFTLEEQTREQNEIGAVSTIWKPVYRGYCHMRSLSSSEYWQAAAQQRQDEIKVFCRWDRRLDVDTRTVRLILHGHAYDIKSVENVEMRNEECVMRVVRRSG